MVYLDARSQCGSMHGSTSDDTGSSMSTVVDRFSTSDRVSTVSTASTASTASEQQSGEFAGVDRDVDRSSDRDTLLSRAICPLEHLERDFSSNPPDYLLRRLAISEAVTHVESRGEIERITAVVAPNTVLIEETITLQPPLSFQDAPLSYGHETRPDLFYTADLAGDSTTHFRPIKDDVELVERVNANGHEEFRETTDVPSVTCERVGNGDRSSSLSSSPPPPPLPARNHINRICVNQDELGNEAHPRIPVNHERESPDAPLLPPKPLPRKDVKTRRKRPPPPPPPPIIAPRREVKSITTMESNSITKKENGDQPQVKSVAEYVQLGLYDSSPNSDNVLDDEKTRGNEDSDSRESFQVPESATKSEGNNEKNADSGEELARTDKVFEIIEIRIAKDYSQPDERKEDAENESDDSCERAVTMEENGIKDETTSRNKQDRLQPSNCTSRISMERIQSMNSESTDGHVDEPNDEGDARIDSESINGKKTERNNNRDTLKETSLSNKEDSVSVDNSVSRGENEDDESYRSLDEVNDDMKNAEVNGMLEDAEMMEDEEDTTDESDDGEYYWQSNLATIGEEEETNSLEYVNT